MKILCVLYDDPKKGMPKSYPLSNLPKLDKYPDGMTLPSPKGIDFNPGELLGCVSGELGLRKFLLHDIKLKEIPAGGGFHAWHYENGALEVSRRQFVVQVYLNDDFDGGETEFLYQQRREEAVAGDVLIFPASFTHTHRGNPPLGGTKYIATSWGVIQGENNF